MSDLKPDSCRWHDVFFKEVHNVSSLIFDSQCSPLYAMFSVGTTHPRYTQPFAKSYVPQVPKGFSVRVFKAPTFSSFPYVASNKYEQNNRSPPSAEPRQTQNWYSSRSNSTSPSELPKLSRSQTSSHSSVTANQGPAYDSNARPTGPRYSIYQSAKDTYIYESSLSSKTDLYSNSEYDDASTATYTPSSLFSPAMSTDSITSDRGAITPNASSTDLRSSTPAPTSLSSARTPNLAQAQPPIRNMFRSQTSREGQTTVVHPPHAAHAASRPLVPVDVSRSTTPIRLSTSSGSVPRTIHDLYPPESGQPPSRVLSPSSESEHSERDRVARANAQYNAAESASSSAYYSARDSMNISNIAPSEHSGVDGGVQFFPELPLRRSPPQHTHPQSSASYVGSHSRAQSPSYHLPGSSSRAADSSLPQSSSYHHTSPSSEATLTNERELFTTSDRSGSQGLRQPLARRPVEEPPTSQIPQIRNDGPAASRYVPASRTMLPNRQPETRVASPEPTVFPTTIDDRPSATITYPQRERRTSIPSIRAPFTSSPPQNSLPQNIQERNISPPEAPAARHQIPEQHRSSEISPSPAPAIVRQASVRHVGLDYTHQSPQTSQPVAPESLNRVISHSSVRASNYTISNTAPSRGANSDPRPPMPEELRRHSSIHHSTSYVPQRTSAEGLTPVLAGQVNTVPRRDRRDSLVAPQHIPPSHAITPNTVAAVVSDTPTQRVQNTFPQIQRMSSIYQQAAGPYHDIRRTLNHPQQETGYKPQEANPRADTVSSSHDFYNLSELSSAVPAPVYPSMTASTSVPRRHVGPTLSRTKSNNTRRLSDYLPPPNHQPFAVPTVYSDPGPENDYQRPPPPEPRHRGQADSAHLGSVPIVGMSTQWPPAAPPSFVTITPSTAPGIDATRSRTSYSDGRSPLAEPQRSNSDGDQNMVNGLVYPRGHPIYVTPDAYASASAEPQPQRRNSDGDQAHGCDRTSIALFRTVRWNENLICPSPIFPHQRRKGWFNRRGDQLWTNEGAYKPASQGREYPPDLDDYPEHGDGWMNEECVRIDMGHRLIPKAPLKSALKQPSTHLAISINN